MAGVRPVNAGWFNAFRPWTLHGAVVPVALGGVYAYIHGSQEWFLFLLALIGGVLLQSACNLLNTYGDFETGLDTEENHSRSPELVSGKLRAKDVLMVGLGCLAITACLGIVMIALTGWGILWFGLAGLATAGMYTIGLKYKYFGLGLPSVFISMGLLMPMGTYYLMTGDISLDLLWISLPNAFMITAVLNGNELRDFISDRDAGVRTVSVRLGYDRAMFLYRALNTLPFVMVPIMVIVGILPIYTLIVMLALYHWNIMYRNTKTAREDRRSGFMLVPFAFKLNWVFGLLLIVGILLGYLFPITW